MSRDTRGNRPFDEMTRGELIEELRQLGADLETGSPKGGRTTGHGPESRVDTAQLLHDLQVHQIELEMQNRELREGQQQLEASRARYSDLYDFAPVAYVTIDESGLITEANLSATALFGIERSRLVGRRLISLVHPAERQRLEEHRRRTLWEEGKQSAEFAIVSRDGGSGLRPRIVQMVSERTRGHDGQAKSTCSAALIDVTALKESERRLQVLADSGRSLLAAPLDQEERLGASVRLVVPEVADLCVGDLLVKAGMPVARVEVVSAVASDQAFASALRRSPPNLAADTPMARAWRTGECIYLPDCTFDELVSLLDGHAPPSSAHAPISLMACPLSLHGHAVGVLTFVTTESRRRYSRMDRELAEDIARRAAMAIENATYYQAAQAAVQARDEMLAVVSHDLRNPLHVMRLNAQSLLMTGPDVEPWPGRKKVEAIARGIATADRMIGDLLLASSMDAGRLSVTLKEHAVAELLLEVREMLEPLAVEGGQRLVVELPEKPLYVLGDRDRLLQVFANIGGNAVKFTPSGGEIVVRTRGGEREICFSVQDSGTGIDERHLARIFERHFQASLGAAKKGSGLGLYIAKGIVESHGGRIWAESQPGVGSTLCFTLPAALPARAVPHFNMADVPKPHAAVLIVDDNVDGREVMAQILSTSGYEVAEAGNGLEALDHLRKSSASPQLILLDLKMPVMDGWQLVAELRKDARLARIPIVLVSGAHELDAEAASLKVAGYIRKPLSVEQLLSAVLEKTSLPAVG